MINIILGYTTKFASRWLILLMDILVVVISYSVATFIRFNFSMTFNDLQEYLLHVPLVVAARALSFLWFKTNHGIIRHTSFEDTLLIFKSVSASSVLLWVLSYALPTQLNGVFSIPRSIIVIDYFILLVSLVLIRLTVKTGYEYLLRRTSTVPQRVILYGAGMLGIMTKNILLQDKKKNVRVLCYIDDNPSLIGKTVEGIHVLSREQAYNLFLSDPENRKDIEIIFTIGAIDKETKRLIIEEYLDLGMQVKSIPPAERWIDGELSINQIENIRIEDLLERDQIKLNNSLIKEHIRGQRVMITGAAGSIGSEIVRQVLPFNPAEITLVDQAESPLYDLQTELIRIADKITFGTKIHVEVASVTDKTHMQELFTAHRPQLLFHAAAYKHVPLMENSPYKAFEVNVLGTKVVADLAAIHGVKKFVLISTDKAVNPTNVMGATKRMAEMYVQSINSCGKYKTRYIATRFGNVLGSNGSVIPLFKKQIEHGGPVTVTHPDIIRYFMTIPEACQLVLEAGVMGQGGEIFVFDMGKPVRIADLAKKMIQLSGLVPNEDIAIEYTGLREGEKLYEELLGHSEKEMPTHHAKIRIAQLQIHDYKYLNEKLEQVKGRMNSISNLDIVTFLKQEIPEYISNNSIYELLDNSVKPEMGISNTNS